MPVLTIEARWMANVPRRLGLSVIAISSPRDWFCRQSDLGRSENLIPMPNVIPTNGRTEQFHPFLEPPESRGTQPRLSGFSVFSKRQRSTRHLRKSDGSPKNKSWTPQVLRSCQATVCLAACCGTSTPCDSTIRVRHGIRSFRSRQTKNSHFPKSPRLFTALTHLFAASCLELTCSGL